MTALSRTRPPAVVLGLGVNGLSVTRSLGTEGIEVHGVCTGPGEPGRRSRYCRTTVAAPAGGGEEAFVDWLAGYCARLDRPVVLPTSDRLVLLLARHYTRLAGLCRLWTNSSGLVESLISKQRFLALVEAAALRSPPSLVEPREDEVRRWCAVHPPPYLVKPFHEDAMPNPIGCKNRVVPSVEELLASAASAAGLRGLIVQRMLRGGDGWHYTVAGLCDRAGKLRGLVTKRKLVQYPPDSGIVAYAVLPACDDDGELAYLEATRSLVRQLRYHGLFGLEWLKERSSGDIFAIDFNPRSLYGNSHILAAGVNLPYLAYRDLCGEDLSEVLERPRLRSVTWADSWGCVGSWWRLRGSRRLTLGTLLSMLTSANAWAVWSARDPFPALSHAAMQLANRWRSLRRQARSVLPAVSSAARG